MTGRAILYLNGSLCYIRQRTQAERWLHERHVCGVQSFPPSFFFSLDGMTIWRYKIRTTGMMYLLVVLLPLNPSRRPFPCHLRILPPPWS